MHVYSDSPVVELFINGVSKGWQNLTPPARGGPSYAQYSKIPFQPGNITAIGLDAHGERMSADTVLTPAMPAAIVLTVDAPSGDAAAIFADGQVG